MVHECLTPRTSGGNGNDCARRGVMIAAMARQKTKTRILSDEITQIARSGHFLKQGASVIGVSVP
jgi:hypothetical protein